MKNALVVKWISSLPSKQLLGVRIPPRAQNVFRIALVVPSFAPILIGASEGREVFKLNARSSEAWSRDQAQESSRG